MLSLFSNTNDDLEATGPMHMLPVGVGVFDNLVRAT